MSLLDIRRIILYTFHRKAIAGRPKVGRDRKSFEKIAGFKHCLFRDVCRGDSHIAKLRFERDVAEVVYKAAMEAINGLKLQIKILDAQIEREWKS